MKKRKQSKANESQLVVPIPLWLQRRMVKNIVLAACSRGTSTGTKLASEILAAIMKGAMK